MATHLDGEMDLRKGLITLCRHGVTEAGISAVRFHPSSSYGGFRLRCAALGPILNPEPARSVGSAGATVASIGASVAQASPSH